MRFLLPLLFLLVLVPVHAQAQRPNFTRAQYPELLARVQTDRLTSTWLDALQPDTEMAPPVAYFRLKNLLPLFRDSARKALAAFPDTLSWWYPLAVACVNESPKPLRVWQIVQRSGTHPDSLLLRWEGRLLYPEGVIVRTAGGKYRNLKTSIFPPPDSLLKVASFHLYSELSSRQFDPDSPYSLRYLLPLLAQPQDSLHQGVLHFQIGDISLAAAQGQIPYDDPALLEVPFGQDAVVAAYLQGRTFLQAAGASYQQALHRASGPQLAYARMSNVLQLQGQLAFSAVDYISNQRRFPLIVAQLLAPGRPLRKAWHPLSADSLLPFVRLGVLQYPGNPKLLELLVLLLVERGDDAEALQRGLPFISAYPPQSTLHLCLAVASLRQKRVADALSTLAYATSPSDLDGIAPATASYILLRAAAVAQQHTPAAWSEAQKLLSTMPALSGYQQKQAAFLWKALTGTRLPR